MKLLSVSVDLDGLGCYAAIHGLGAHLDERALRAVPVVALERLCELFDELSIPATFFAIGRELEEVPGAAEALGRAALAGHEVASHSWSHDYALARSAPEAIALDLERAEKAIEAACGVAPRGFRAPGYTLSPALLAAVRGRGYLYDSSLLPSPAYYAAKAAAMALHALRGRKSASILGGPGQLFRSRRPHWIDGVRELPVATLPLLRVPIIGTVLTAAPERAAALLLRAAGAGGHVNLELHGIDALDPGDGIPATVAAAQAAARVPAARKLARLRGAIAAVKERAEAVTLEAAARKLLPG